MLNLVNPLIISWKKSTEYDHNFDAYEKVTQHDDGFGSFQYLNNNDKEQFSIVKNFHPAFTVDHSINLDYDSVSNFILLNHARKASKSMPISLNQNHPFSNETGTLVLAHNGTIHKDAIIPFLRTNHSSYDNFSDTQLLFDVLRERFDSTKPLNPTTLFSLWKDLIQQLKNNLVNLSVKYSMNLLFLVKDPQSNTFTLLYSSLYSDPRSEDYFKLYTSNGSTATVLCSSTIVHYLEKDFPSIKQKLNLQIIPNGTIGLISQNSAVEKIQEVL